MNYKNEEKVDKKILKTDALGNLEDLTRKIEALAQKKSEPISRRYPLTFSVLGLVGFLSVLYSFERIIDNIDFLRSNPVIVLVVGIILLFITGTFYKRLQTK